MKKKIILGFLLIIGLQSCQSERLGNDEKEQDKFEALAEFNQAFKNLGSKENRKNEEELRSNSSELSERRMLTLVPSALQVIKSESFTEDQIQKQTGGNSTAIVVWALKIQQNSLSSNN